MMKLIRWVLGKVILFLDRVFTPTAMQRSAQDQAKIDARTSSLMIYELKTCPFCVKVRRSMKRLNLKITLRDVANDPKAYQELMEGGKQDQVPCLRMVSPEGKVQWLYESSDIIQYLETEFLAH